MLYGLAIDNHNLIFISIRPFFPTHVKKNKVLCIITQFSVLNVINFLNVYLIVIFETAMACGRLKYNLDLRLINLTVRKLHH